MEHLETSAPEVEQHVVLYHIAIPGAYHPGSTYTPDTFKQDGFIQLCSQTQLPIVLERHYKDIRPLHLLHLKADLTVKWQAGSDGEEYPHLFRALEPEDVESVEKLDDLHVTIDHQG